MYARRSELNVVLLERGLPGGQLLNTDLIDDYPGLPEIDGRDLAERMTSHAQKFGLEIQMATVGGIKKLEDGDFRITTEEGATYRAGAVILTAGGTPTKLEVPGEEEYAGRGVSYCAICDGAFFKGETIAVAGGGDAATEEAEFLTRYVEKLYLIHRRDELRAQKILQKRVFENPKIEIIWDTVIEEVVGEAGGMKGLRLKNVKSGSESTLDATGIFVFIGFRPNTGLLEDHAEHDSGGYLISDIVRGWRRQGAAHPADHNGGRRRDDGYDRGGEISYGQKRSIIEGQKLNWGLRHSTADARLPSLAATFDARLPTSPIPKIRIDRGTGNGTFRYQE
jgi:thioredoxin reductase (NADPH)